MSLPHEQYELLEDMVDRFTTEVDWEDELDLTYRSHRNLSRGPIASVFEYFEGYGFSFDYMGNYAMEVDSGWGTFVNHGCNRTFNVGAMHSWTEWEYNDHAQPLSRKERQALRLDAKPYSPYVDRNIRVWECREEVAMRDIRAGEELFNNYMEFVQADELDSYAYQLQQECTGGLVGSVVQYEAMEKASL